MRIAVAATTAIIAVIAAIIIDANYDIKQGYNAYKARLCAYISGKYHRLKQGNSQEKTRKSTHWRCWKCGKTMHRGVKSEHLRSHRPDPEPDHETTTVSTEDFETRGDLVDDYETPWLEDRDQEDELELQEPTGAKHKGGNVQKLLRIRDYINQVIDEHGRYTIRKQTHIGSVRGGHILQDFKKGVRRHETDVLDNYEIDEGYPITIERV